MSNIAYMHTHMCTKASAPAVLKFNIVYFHSSGIRALILVFSETVVVYYMILPLIYGISFQG